VNESCSFSQARALGNKAGSLRNSMKLIDAFTEEGLRTA
jgi:hypothetical protein